MISERQTAAVCQGFTQRYGTGSSQVMALRDVDMNESRIERMVPHAASQEDSCSHYEEMRSAQG